MHGEVMIMINVFMIHDTGTFMPRIYTSLLLSWLVGVYGLVSYASLTFKTSVRREKKKKKRKKAKW